MSNTKINLVSLASLYYCPNRSSTSVQPPACNICSFFCIFVLK